MQDRLPLYSTKTLATHGRTIHLGQGSAANITGGAAAGQAAVVTGIGASAFGQGSNTSGNYGFSRPVQMPLPVAQTPLPSAAATIQLPLARRTSTPATSASVPAALQA